MDEEKLAAALFRIEDTLGRAMCPFILLGETARSIMEGEHLKGDKVEVGVQTKHLTKEVFSTLNFYEPDREDHDWGFAVEFEGVPIEVRYITRDYKFLKNKDFRFYRAGEYLLPNPFDDYWNVRGLIK